MIVNGTLYILGADHNWNIFKKNLAAEEGCISEFFHDLWNPQKRKWPLKGIPGKAGGRQNLKDFLPTPVSASPLRSQLSYRSHLGLCFGCKCPREHDMDRKVFPFLISQFNCFFLQLFTFLLRETGTPFPGEGNFASGFREETVASFFTEKLGPVSLPAICRAPRRAPGAVEATGKGHLCHASPSPSRFCRKTR